MPECIKCGDVQVRENMISLDGWFDPPDDPDVVCLRCASVAMKGGPSNMTQEEREEHNIILKD